MRFQQVKTQDALVVEAQMVLSIDDAQAAKVETAKANKRYRGYHATNHVNLANRNPCKFLLYAARFLDAKRAMS